MSKGASIKNSNPDHGRASYDKGYESDESHFSPPGVYPGKKERGNEYMKHQNEAVKEIQLS